MAYKGMNKMLLEQVLHSFVHFQFFRIVSAKLTKMKKKASKEVEKQRFSYQIMGIILISLFSALN